MKRIYALGILTTCFLFFYLSSVAQELRWHNPLNEDGAVHGQLDGATGYARLPPEAKATVRPAVWNLSQHATGLELRFLTDASSIYVRYIPTGSIQLPHMPATGVSGLDLYLKNGQGNLDWVRGSYAFGDTVSYVFRVHLSEKTEREYKLYLPLYNGVESLEIGVPKESYMTTIPKSLERPIVVYGTSIAQGACASRPGMAWTAIMGRHLNRTVINLGFSGNGQLEPEVLEHIAANKAALFILDCLPNLVPNLNRSENDIRNKLTSSVKFLRDKNPDTPILIVEHAGYSDSLTDRERDETIRRVNSVAKAVYKELLSEGHKAIFLLTKEEIDLSFDATVDGTHPSDLGMDQIASAYVEVVKQILQVK
jgi:lysophospholipase L1-like esterase